MKHPKIAYASGLAVASLATGCTVFAVITAVQHQGKPVTALAVRSVPRMTATTNARETTPKVPAVSTPQTCADSAPDTSYTAYVAGTGSVCNSLSQSLAGDGVYWSPVTGSLGAAGNPLCVLASGDSTITVFDISSEDEPIGGYVAQSVCQSAEANGWIPQT